MPLIMGPAGADDHSHSGRDLRILLGRGLARSEPDRGWSGSSSGPPSGSLASSGAPGSGSIAKVTSLLLAGIAVMIIRMAVIAMRLDGMRH